MLAAVGVRGGMFPCLPSCRCSCFCKSFSASQGSFHLICAVVSIFVVSGEIILVIFPDGTGPALMSCMIAGIPFSDVHALEYGPGEVRVDITPESVMALYRQRRDDPAYLAKIEEGKDKLAALRQQRTIVGLKEQMAEQERLDIDAAYERRRTADAQRERERQQQREAQLQARRELGEAKERERREQQEARWNRGDNGKAGAAAGPSLVATGGETRLRRPLRRCWPLQRWGRSASSLPPSARPMAETPRTKGGRMSEPIVGATKSGPMGQLPSCSAKATEPTLLSPDRPCRHHRGRQRQLRSEGRQAKTSQGPMSYCPRQRRNLHLDRSSTSPCPFEAV